MITLLATENQKAEGEKEKKEIRTAKKNLTKKIPVFFFKFKIKE
jgi:hypothetical protein